MPERDRTMKDHVPQRLDRPCGECGEQLPAGVVFHVDKGCAKAHREKVLRQKGLKR